MNSGIRGGGGAVKGTILRGFDCMKVTLIGFLYAYWAMTSRPLHIGLMALCWMAEGFSKPGGWY